MIAMDVEISVVKDSVVLEAGDSEVKFFDFSPVMHRAGFYFYDGSKSPFNYIDNPLFVLRPRPSSVVLMVDGSLMEFSVWVCQKSLWLMAMNTKNGSCKAVKIGYSATNVSEKLLAMLDDGSLKFITDEFLYFDKRVKVWKFFRKVLEFLFSGGGSGDVVRSEFFKRFSGFFKFLEVLGE